MVVKYKIWFLSKNEALTASQSFCETNFFYLHKEN